MAPVESGKLEFSVVFALTARSDLLRYVRMNDGKEGPSPGIVTGLVDHQD